MIAAGLDLSLTGAGVALAWRDQLGQEGILHTRLETGPAGYQLGPRWSRISGQAGLVVDRVCARGRPDVVLVEGPAHGAVGGSAHDRSGLWWLVVGRLVANGVPVVEVVTQHLKMYATGRGTKVTKDHVLAETARRYLDLAPQLSSNDEADAVTLAALGLHRVTGQPLVALPQTHTRALAAVKWPDHVPLGTERKDG